jgi:hypothetical protein
MKKVLIIVGVMLVAGLSKASVIVDWNFDLEKFSNGSSQVFGTTADYGIADSGNNAAGSDASGFHASTITWSFAAGNPGQSLSADHWAKNDYFQFSVSTAGYKNIQLKFDQISSPSGPGIFILEYSTTGASGTFNKAGSDYTITKSSFTVSSSTFTVDLSSLTGLNNDSSVVFRLFDDSTTSESGGFVGSTGASHIDNFIVNGDMIPVPEPAAWGAISGLGLLGICGLRTWRERRSGNHIAKA